MPANQPKTSQEWLQRGNALMENGDYKAALEIYDYILQKEPTNTRLYVYKATALASLNCIHEATCLCDYAIRLDPMDVFAYSTKGRILDAVEHRRQDIALKTQKLDLVERIGKTFGL